MVDGKIRRFNTLKTEQGFNRLLSLDAFEYPLYGYFFKDSCVFGAKVFVIKNLSIGPCLDIQRLTYNNTYSWKIKNLSTRIEEYLFSDSFKIQELNWYVILFSFAIFFSIFFGTIFCFCNNWYFEFNFHVSIGLSPWKSQRKCTRGRNIHLSWTYEITKMWQSLC